MNRLKNLNTLKLVFPCLPSRLQLEKQLLKAPGFSAWSKLEVFPKRLAHAWKRLVVRRGSWRCVTDTRRMRTPSTYGSVGMGRYGHGPSKRKLPTSHCASTWRLCQIINSWPLRNFLVETRETWRCRWADLFRFGITWYHYHSSNGHRFPSSSTCHQGYRWVPVFQCHGPVLSSCCYNPREDFQIPHCRFNSVHCQFSPGLAPPELVTSWKENDRHCFDASLHYVQTYQNELVQGTRLETNTLLILVCVKKRQTVDTYQIQYRFFRKRRDLPTWIQCSFEVLTLDRDYIDISFINQLKLL